MKNSVISARLSLLGLALVLVSPGVNANNLGENSVWQFNTAQDKVNKTTTLDQIQKQKAGYYDGLRPVYNYTTYIDRQFNCSVSAMTTANTGSNANSASNSSPSVNNAGTTSSSTDANSASNSLPQNSVNGTSATPLTSSLVSNQSNTGSLASGVTGSSTSAATGAVTAGSGTSNQALNSNQSNTGSLSAGITGSNACVGPLN
jgi:hypothetical protein